MKIKYILFCLVIVLAVFRFWQLTGCLSFSENVFKSQNVVTNVETHRLYDDDPNNVVAKAFHNKLLSGPNEVLLTMSSYVEPRYVLDLAGPLGLISGAIALYTIVVRKNVKGLLYISTFAFVLLVASFTSLPAVAAYAFAALWFASITWSVGFFLKNKKTILLFFILWVSSLLYFFINWKFAEVCSNIFFN